MQNAHRDRASTSAVLNWGVLSNTLNVAIILPTSRHERSGGSWRLMFRGERRALNKGHAHSDWRQSPNDIEDDMINILSEWPIVETPIPSDLNRRNLSVSPDRGNSWRIFF